MVNGAPASDQERKRNSSRYRYNAVGGARYRVNKDSPFYELGPISRARMYRAVRFRRARLDADLAAEAGLPPRFLEISFRNRRKSHHQSAGKSASTRTATSFVRPNCCRSKALPARSMTAPKQVTDVPRRRRPQDFAENIPRSLVAYIKALMEAND